MRVVLVISSHRGLCDSIDKIVARARCRAVVVPDCATAERVIDHLRPVLILIDPLRREELSARTRGMCDVVEIPIRVSGSGVRRLAKASHDAVRWLTGLVAEHCAATP